MENVKIGCFDHIRLKKLRESRNWTQEQLAQKTGLSVQGISRLERRPEIAGTDTLAKLAQAFEVPYGFLLGENFLNPKQYSSSSQLATKIDNLLEKIFNAKCGASQIIDSLSAFIEQNMVHEQMKMDLDGEEKVLGLWWSIIGWYQAGNWKEMIKMAEVFIEHANSLGRPFLVVAGRTYLAKAYRNLVGEENLKMAKCSIEKNPKSKDYQSVMTHRINGKIYLREGKFAEALSEFECAEAIVQSSDRNDALFLLERTKLMRNKATAHQHLAVKAGSVQDEQNEARHIRSARQYLQVCEQLIEELSAQCQHEGRIEAISLIYENARFAECQGNLEKAKILATEALNRAKDLTEKLHANKLRMYLFHINMERGDIDGATGYYAELVSSDDWQYIKNGDHYDNFVRKHEAQMRNHVLSRG